MEAHGEGVGGPLEEEASGLVVEIDPAVVLDGQAVQEVLDGLVRKAAELVEDGDGVGVE